MGASWAVFGPLGQSWAALGVSWAVLGPSWRHVGQSWCRPGQFGSSRGASGGHVVLVLGVSGPVLTHVWPARVASSSKFVPGVLQKSLIHFTCLCIFDMREIRPLGAVWDHPGAVLGASWQVLGPSRDQLGLSWGRLGGPGAVLGPSWGSLGRCWDRLGAILVCLGDLLGCPGGRAWEPLGKFGKRGGGAKCF